MGERRERLFVSQAQHLNFSLDLWPMGLIVQATGNKSLSPLPSDSDAAQLNHRLRSFSSADCLDAFME